MSNQAAQPPATETSAVLADLAHAINQGPDVRDVQAMVVEKAVAALGASAGSVLLPTDGPGPMRVVAAIGLVGSEMPVGSRVAEWVVQHDAPLLLMGRTGPLAHLLRRDDVRDAVCVPLRYAGRPIGALNVSNSVDRGPFHNGDVDILTAIGHLAAVALRNTQLYDEARGHRERLQEVLSRLWTAQEDERRRLASDLHDGPAQALFHIVFRLQTAARQVSDSPATALPCMAHAEEAARDALAQVRAIMAGLRPMSLDDLGLVPALRNECEAMSHRGRVAVEVSVTGKARRFHPDVEDGLFRMAREALSNAERHSGAERARLEVRSHADGLDICVRDWGRGFDEETTRAARAKGRIGLLALKERAHTLGVDLDVDSSLGRGTRVTLRCPTKE